MKKTIVIVIMMMTTGILFYSCSKDSDNGGGGGLDCNTVANKAFAADVNPIVQATCNTVNCHNAGSINGPGPITNYNEVFANRVAIRIAIANGSMPKNIVLTTAQKNSILCWIDAGAPNN